MQGVCSFMELKEKVVNTVNGEEFTKPYTKEQLAEVEAAQLEAAQRQAEAQAKAEAKAAAEAKLVALGLTVTDLEALGL